MSTAVMWLLLFIVVALGILIAALSKTKFTTKKIATIGIMAALILVYRLRAAGLLCAELAPAPGTAPQRTR